MNLEHRKQRFTARPTSSDTQTLLERAAFPFSASFQEMLKFYTKRWFQFLEWMAIMAVLYAAFYSLVELNIPNWYTNLLGIVSVFSAFLTVAFLVIFIKEFLNLRRERWSDVSKYIFFVFSLLFILLLIVTGVGLPIFAKIFFGVSSENTFMWDYLW